MKVGEHFPDVIMEELSVTEMQPAGFEMEGGSHNLRHVGSV